MTASKLVAAPFVKDKGPAKIFMLTFEDGTSGEYFSQAGTLPFLVGDILHFDVAESQFLGKPKHIKINTMTNGTNGEDKPSKNPQKDASISALAIVKSCLEGRLIDKSEVKELYDDMFHFFYYFKPRAL